MKLRAYSTGFICLFDVGGDDGGGDGVDDDCKLIFLLALFSYWEGNKGTRLSL